LQKLSLFRGLVFFGFCIGILHLDPAFAAKKSASKKSAKNSACAKLAAINVNNLNSVSRNAGTSGSKCTMPKPSPEEKIHILIQQAICRKDISDAAEVVVGDDQGVWLNYKSLPNDNRLYDLASLTKPIATATAVLKLVDSGRLKLNEQIGAIFSRFGMKAFNRFNITVDDLLRHRSGLHELNGNYLYAIAGNSSRSRAAWTGLERIASHSNPRTKKLPIYRDSNYFILSEIVRLVSGTGFEPFVSSNILAPLEMKRTRFAGPREVADPLARTLGGVSGSAGLLSTGTDLGKFAQMFLNNGKTPNGGRILSNMSLNDMKTSYYTDEQRRFIDTQNAGSIEFAKTEMHAAGFDVNPSILRGSGFSMRSFGHTGSTGTSMLIDPDNKVYVILLARNRRDEDPPVRMNALRKAIATEGMALVRARRALEECVQAQAQAQAAQNSSKRLKTSPANWLQDHFRFRVFRAQ